MESRFVDITHAGGERHTAIALPERLDPILLPVIGANDELLPSAERLIGPVARRAQDGDAAARDALFAAFQPKLHRIARRLYVPLDYRTICGVWDRNDVTQEAYLVFLDMIEKWTPGTPFGPYVFANFPWRLRDATYRKVGRRGVPPRSVAVSVDELDWQSDDSWKASESVAVIECLAASLESPLDDMLRIHILDGESITATAARMGISRRTAFRYRARIRERLAGDLVPAPSIDA